jgi:sugar-specific transcriptional regulator TrmB
LFATTRCVLHRFGFTPTESKSYQALLHLGPSTGYAVALELGIARANVYQALESLVRRGAARKASTIPVHYSAVGPAALLTELERGFRRDLLALDDELQRLPLALGSVASAPELIVSADRLLSRAAVAAGDASTELMVVSGPWAPALADQLVRATGRGVSVRSVFLGEPAPPGATVRPVDDAELRAYWGGLPVGLVADRRRAVFGVLAGDGTASGLDTTAPGAVPFIRHLLRRELSGGA